MPLPKISNPIHNIKIPSSGNKIPVRQMTIKDEKILLVAKESDDDTDRQGAILQVINNCVMEDGFDVNTLTMFDVEYLFLKIRALSVSNKVELSITEFDDDGNKITDHPFSIDLNDVDIKKADEEVENKVILDDIIIELKYPTMEMYTSNEYKNAETDSNVMSIILKHSIASVYQGDRSFQFTLDEAGEFIEQLPASSFEKITKFFQNQPSLFYELSYKDSKGKKQKQELTSLSDFFIF